MEKFVRLVSTGEEVAIRLGKAEDYDELVLLSDITHKKHDSLPLTFLKILQSENSYVFVALIQARLAGCVVSSFVDSDTTLVMWGMRIHPMYRRRNISLYLREAVLTFARKKYPLIECERFTANIDNSHVRQLRLKLGFKRVLELKALSVYIADDVRKLLGRVLQAMKPMCSTLKLVANEDTLQFIDQINQQKIQTLVIDHVPYELIRSNAKWINEENDVCLVDRVLKNPPRPMTKKLLKLVPGLHPKPLTFSHGRAVPRTQCTYWEATLHADKRDSFRNHLLYQLQAALKATQGKFVFTSFHSDSNAEFAWEFLLRDLGLRHVDDHVIRKLVLYERPFDSGRHDVVSEQLENNKPSATKYPDRETLNNLLS